MRKLKKNRGELARTRWIRDSVYQETQLIVEGMSSNRWKEDIERVQIVTGRAAKGNGSKGGGKRG